MSIKINRLEDGTIRTHWYADDLLKHYPSKGDKYVIDEELQHSDHLFLGVACFKEVAVHFTRDAHFIEDIVYIVCFNYSLFIWSIKTIFRCLLLMYINLFSSTCINFICILFLEQ